MQKKNPANLQQEATKKKKQEGYTPRSAQQAAKRNCIACGGTWTGTTCVGGQC